MLIKTCPEHPTWCGALFISDTHVSVEAANNPSPQAPGTQAVVWTFPAEDLDITALPCPYWFCADSILTGSSFNAAQSGMICYAAVRTCYSQQTHQLCLATPVASGRGLGVCVHKLGQKLGKQQSPTLALLPRSASSNPFCLLLN